MILEEGMFHVVDGLYFQKLKDGAVRVLKTAGGQEDSPVIFDQTLEASQWASVIATMSYLGEEDGGFYHAMHYHTGEKIPDAYTYRLKGIECGSKPEEPAPQDELQQGPIPSLD